MFWFIIRNSLIFVVTSTMHAVRGDHLDDISTSAVMKTTWEGILTCALMIGLNVLQNGLKTTFT